MLSTPKLSQISPINASMEKNCLSVFAMKVTA
jgi:hypothetical protein